MIGIGVTAHEGQLFGLANQLLDLVLAIGFLVLAVTAPLPWRRRGSHGALGSAPAQSRQLAPLYVARVLSFAIFLPTQGVSFAVVLLFELALRRLSPAASRWLGREPHRSSASPSAASNAEHRAPHHMSNAMRASSDMRL